MRSLHPSRTRMVLIHGGAGAKKPIASQRACLSEALVIGFNLIQEEQSSLDAVEAMIRHLEGSGRFNAGTGSRSQLDGVQRMDAAIMEGQRLQAGAVAGLETIRHPISAARLVMEETDHVLLIGTHAIRFARHFRLKRLPRKENLPHQENPRQKNKHSNKSLKLYKKMSRYDTVGAVALDGQGNLAAGASTGGVSMMLPGRVGDTPLIGSGVYADNKAGAISMTGLGENIIRLAMAKHIALSLKHGKSPTIAARQTMRELVDRIQGEAGCLVLAPNGRFTIRHSTPWMSAGYWNGRGTPIVLDQFN